MEEAGVGPMKPLEDTNEANAEKPALGTGAKKKLPPKRSVGGGGSGVTDDEDERRTAASASAVARSGARGAAVSGGGVEGSGEYEKSASRRTRRTKTTMT